MDSVCERVNESESKKDMFEDETGTHRIIMIIITVAAVARMITLAIAESVDIANAKLTLMNGFVKGVPRQRLSSHEIRKTNRIPT